MIKLNFDVLMKLGMNEDGIVTYKYIAYSTIWIPAADHEDYYDAKEVRI